MSKNNESEFKNLKLHDVITSTLKNCIDNSNSTAKITGTLEKNIREWELVNDRDIGIKYSSLKRACRKMALVAINEGKNEYNPPNVFTYVKNYFNEIKDYFSNRFKDSALDKISSVAGYDIMQEIKLEIRNPFGDIMSELLDATPQENIFKEIDNNLKYDKKNTAEALIEKPEMKMTESVIINMRKDNTNIFRDQKQENPFADIMHEISDAKKPEMKMTESVIVTTSKHDVNNIKLIIRMIKIQLQPLQN